MQSPYAVRAIGSRLQPAAQLVVAAIIHGFQVDLEEVQPRPQVFERLGRSVPVGDKPGHQSRCLGFAEHRNRKSSVERMSRNACEVTQFWQYPQ